MMTKAIPPRRLRRGDTVAIIAPSSPFDSEELREGVAILKEFGLRVKLGPTVRNLRTYQTHTGTLEDRVGEMMWAFTDPGISGVIVATGGYGCPQLLPYLDYEAIRVSQRILLGMSDITAIQNAILHRSNLVSISGQSPNTRQDHEWHDSDVECFRFTVEMLMSGDQWGDRPMEINSLLPRTLYPGRAVGQAVGGNLDTFAHLLGTPFMPEVDGAILFIEDVHKGGMPISRDLTQLELAGVFDRLAGVVVGEFFDIPEERSDRDPPIDLVLIEHFGDRGIPCVTNVSFSHGRYTVPIPIGAMCQLDAGTGEVSFDFALV